MNYRKFGLGKMIIIINIVIGLVFYVVIKEMDKYLNDMISLSKKDDRQPIENSPQDYTYNQRQSKETSPPDYTYIEGNYPIALPGSDGKMKITSIKINNANNYVYYDVKLYYGKKENKKMLEQIWNNREGFKKNICKDERFIKNFLQKYNGIYFIHSDDYGNQNTVIYLQSNECK